MPSELLNEAGYYMTEKRSSERFSKKLPITFSNDDGHYRGMSSNFSDTGIFVITREPFTPGDHIKMSLEVTEKKKIHLAGTVVRAIKTGIEDVKDGMGIKLENAPFIYHNFVNSIAG